MPSPGKIIIIGSGIIGTACAHELIQRDWQVTIIDKSTFASQCSHANCGFICPSHALPLPAPGAISKTFWKMFRKNSPFYIKPRLSPSLWHWFFKFWRRCKHDLMLETAKHRADLLNYSYDAYEKLITTHNLDCEYQQKGLLFVYGDPHHFHEYEKTNNLTREHFGIEAKPYDAAQTLALEPALNNNVAGSWHYECDAHLRPDRLMAAWRSLLEKQGVTIKENCEFLAFESQSNHATKIRTSTGHLEADHFLIATGATTPLLNKQLGVNIPIQPGKGYSITMPRPNICPQHPIIFEEIKVAVTPMQSGYRLGSTMEFSGYDTTINPKRLEALKSGAAKFLQEPYTQPIEEEWFGWRPMTYDGLPIIDHSPKFNNVTIAAGHNMLGLSMAPATALLTTQLINNETPFLNPTPYSLKRFR